MVLKLVGAGRLYNFCELSSTQFQKLYPYYSAYFRGTRDWGWGTGQVRTSLTLHLLVCLLAFCKSLTGPSGTPGCHSTPIETHWPICLQDQHLNIHLFLHLHRVLNCFSESPAVPFIKVSISLRCKQKNITTLGLPVSRRN